MLHAARAQLSASYGQGRGSQALPVPPTRPSAPLANLPAPTPVQAARSLPHALEGSWRDDKGDTNLLLQNALEECGTVTRENQTYGLRPWARLGAPLPMKLAFPGTAHAALSMPCKAGRARGGPARRSRAPASLRSHGEP